MRLTEKDKKNLDLNSVHTRPVEGNSEKNSYKFQEIKKTLSGIIFSQNGMRQAENERKKFQTRISFMLDPGKKIPKNYKKKIKKLKKPSPALFLAKMG